MNCCLRRNEIPDCRSTDRIGRLRLWNIIIGKVNVALFRKEVSWMAELCVIWAGYGGDDAGCTPIVSIVKRSDVK